MLHQRTGWILATCATLAIGGCVLDGKYQDYLDSTDASEANYTALANSWIGASEAQLISAWGRPTRIDHLQKKTYLVYADASTELYHRPRPTYLRHFANVVQYPSADPDGLQLAYNFNCETTFEIMNYLIVGWKSRGPNCRATAR